MNALGALAGLGALVLVVAAGLFAVTDTVLTQVSQGRALALEEEGRRNSAMLVGLLERREQVLQSVLVLEIAAIMMATAITTALVADRVGGVRALASMIVAVPFAYLVAEAIPRTWALHRLERAAVLAAPVARLCELFLPSRIVARGSLWLARRLIPGPGEPADDIGHGLLAVTGAPIEVDAIDYASQELLTSLVDFEETVVREVMVPRPDIVSVSADFRIQDVMELVVLHGFTRLPVWGSGIDDVVGVVFAKDLMRASLDGRADRAVGSIMRPPRFVPETKRVAELLREMQRDQKHLAIVVDEYGGTAGLVTLEDTLEEVVGEIVDEFDNEAPLVEELGDGRIRARASMGVDEVRDHFDLRLPEGDWDTIAGLLFTHFGYVPDTGEQAEFGSWSFEVDQVRGNRIETVIVTRPAAQRVGGDN